MEKQPNIIIFSTDDIGYGDLSCQGSDYIKTPNIDSLAATGVKFNNWYSNSPVCSPSRASLLTGKYPGNAGVRSILGGHRTASGLPNTTKTIASILKDAGYDTYMAGKWHLGVLEENRPHNHGFDKWFGHLAGCIDYYSHIFYWGMNYPNEKGKNSNPVHDLWEDNVEIWRNGEYFTELITEKSMEYLNASIRKANPFFLYVPYNAPHYPMHAPQKYVDRFPELPWDKQIMAAMISAVDDSIGEIITFLKQNNLFDNTVIMFTGDNGPSRESRNWLDGSLDLYYGGSTSKLKGHKFSLFDGGIKVPNIISFPDKIAGDWSSNQACMSMDFLPTVLDFLNVDTSSYEFNGISIKSHLQNKTPLLSRSIYWEQDSFQSDWESHSSQRDQSHQTAILKDNWKLVVNGRLVEFDQPVADVFLSNLAEDISESNNLRNEYSEIAKDLELEALNWRSEIEKIPIVE